MPVLYCQGRHLAMPVLCWPCLSYAGHACLIICLGIPWQVPLRSEEYCREGAEADGMPTQHYSLVFTAFVMLQLVNQVNPC